MALKSTFKADLKKERQLFPLLDRMYTLHLKHYRFERISAYDQQLKGIDVVFTHKTTGEKYSIDEKAQLDYINDDLPTFAFEIEYQKKELVREGWLFDTAKKTDFYALVTAIYEDSPNTFTSCKITLVNRKKLLAFLASKGITRQSLDQVIKKHPGKSAKQTLAQLHAKKQGYLYFSNLQKAEKPINLILKLDFLTVNGIAKRLV
ncbi:hypothetical protein EJ994_13380 [Maribacter sp. MJ134]|uniref:hypothetical protein n=1 Tax=Maribacter sp. MJ134 TaxID=2496865 RepID=UPI000F82E1AA|nr:hypothetical protein [Maribacter sp. MJ134]AZQ59739.1 hypothetical protein EJ994_13380 [Maribacter sp. MJ134]